ncbi:hypothetical protein BTG57_10755 [Acinetobacter baumannii]|uniref:hypothetical protein n=1 Tax=Acinetobacter baumannii TaxID=470 RepID=UPI000598ED9C|nr:hypothetical protein [Acinetobacter baumannii]KII22170.1 hypothetical protein PK64_19160 [Acinetobacter baumannii]OOS36241.1 hypothetical protein BTG57_10755 [Acinetobacter baumannii]OVM87015.1 hypothetical protein B4S22_15020 [Acinetobacter baumannii]OVN03421.1 hypothetical protein B4S28_06925 [Acinetobacter baumannii]OVN17440.1 hypothetical protein B4S24_12135 [Acinetobacter baumannii]
MVIGTFSQNTESPTNPVRFIVFYEPAKVVFKGIDLFKFSASEAYKLMASLVKDIAIDGPNSFKFGIGFYEPNYEEEPFLPVEAIIIFIEGYYD